MVLPPEISTLTKMRTFLLLPDILRDFSLPDPETVIQSEGKRGEKKRGKGVGSLSSREGKVKASGVGQNSSRRRHHYDRRLNRTYEGSDRTPHEAGTIMTGG
jgi:hypothetical protein